MAEAGKKKKRRAKKSRAKQEQLTPFEKRFKRGTSELGFVLGFGYTINIPAGPPDRSDLDFVYFYPQWRYNLTGIIGDSFYRGTLNYLFEAGGSVTTYPSTKMLLGINPFLLEYRFLSPKRFWAPTFMLGTGGCYTDWRLEARKELGSFFEFTLQAGAGIEFFKKEKGSFSLNYRFFHISNAGFKKPNIGLNAHLFTLGYSY